MKYYFPFLIIGSAIWIGITGIIGFGDVTLTRADKLFGLAIMFAPPLLFLIAGLVLQKKEDLKDNAGVEYEDQ